MPSNRESIIAYFGGDVKGLREATEEGSIIMKGFSRQAGMAVREIGAGFVGALIFSELIKAGKEAVLEAQKQRDEFEKLNKPIDANTKALAEFGDGMKSVKNGAIEAVGFIVSGWNLIGDSIGSGINRLRGISAAQEEAGEAAQRAADKQVAAAEKLRAAQTDPAAIIALEKRIGDQREQIAAAGLTAEGKISALKQEQLDLETKINGSKDLTVNVLEWQLRLDKNISEQKQTQFDLAQKHAEAEQKIAEETKKWSEIGMSDREKINVMQANLNRLREEEGKASGDQVKTDKLRLDVIKQIEEIDRANIALADKALLPSKERAELVKIELNSERDLIRYSNDKLSVARMVEDIQIKSESVLTNVSDEEKKRWITLQLQSKELQNQVELEDLLKKAPGDLTKADKIRISDLITQNRAIDDQIAKINGTTDATKNLGNAVATVTEQIKIMVTPFGGGKDFLTASDETLKQIVADARQAAKEATYGKSNFDVSNDYASALQTGRQAAAQRELDFRAKLRTDNALGGESYARSNFKGDELSFENVFKQIVGTAGGGLGTNEKTQNAIISIDKKLPNLNQVN